MKIVNKSVKSVQVPMVRDLKRGDVFSVGKGHGLYLCIWDADGCYGLDSEGYFPLSAKDNDSWRFNTLTPWAEVVLYDATLTVERRT